MKENLSDPVCFFVCKVMGHLGLILYVSILPVYMYMHSLCTWYPERLKEGVRSHGVRVEKVVNLGLLQEQQVFLTSEPSVPSSLTPPWHFYYPVCPGALHVDQAGLHVTEIWPTPP